MKQDDLKELFKAIQIVHNGGAYMTELAVTIIQNRLRKSSFEFARLLEIDQLKSNSALEISIKLTPQETKLIRLLQIGKTSKEVAYEMQLTVKTVRTYRERLLRKTKTRNVVELLNICFQTRNHTIF